MGYAKNSGESTEQYVDRIRQEAADNQISSGPGGSFVQNAIDQARGFGASSHGVSGSESQAVQDQFFKAANSGTGPFGAANTNQQVYQDPRAAGGPISTLFSSNPFYTLAQGASGGNNPGGTSTMADPTPSTSPSAITPGMNPAEFEKARQSILYNLQNPEFAMTNALNAKGLSLYNPIIRRGILPAAQGLGTAYSVQGALGNNGPSTDVAGGFQNFINDVLNGAGGGIRGVTGNAMSQLGNLGNTLWSAANAKSAGQVPTNPFIGALLSTLYDPAALTGMETSLALPNLGPALTSGLQELLGLKSNAAWQQIQPTENFYKYLNP